MSDKVIRLAQLSRFLQDLKATVDSALSLNSENPVQNKVVTEALGDKVPNTRTINGKPLSANVELTASDVGAVPTNRTINGKALSSDITLTAEDIGVAITTKQIASLW